MRAGNGVEIREGEAAVETAEVDRGANAGAEERNAADGGRATVERGLGWKLREHGLPRRQASSQYWPGCPFQEAVHGQSKRAHRAQVGVTAAAALGTAVGSGEGDSGSAG